MSNYNKDDVRVLVEQIKENKPKIKIFINEEFDGCFQLRPDYEITEELNEKLSRALSKSHGLTNEDHELDGGCLTDDFEFDETKDVYEWTIGYEGEGYYNIDKFITHLEEFIQEGGNQDEDVPDFTFKGFIEVFEYWMSDYRVEGLNVADAVEHHDDIEFISLEVTFDGIPCIGWESYIQNNSNDVYFEIE